VVALIYPEALTPAIQQALAAIVTIVNVAVYAWVRSRRRRASRA